MVSKQITKQKKKIDIYFQEVSVIACEIYLMPHSDIFTGCVFKGNLLQVLDVSQSCC